LVESEEQAAVEKWAELDGVTFDVDESVDSSPGC
jgi:hypothetical protein